MSNIRFEWITGKRLMERWDLDLRELHMVIQNGLPVYNSNYELEDQGPIYNKTPNPDYDPDAFIPKEYIVEKNNLYDLQVLLETPFPVTNTGLTKNQILSNLLFKIDDVLEFEQKHKSIKKKKSLEAKDQQVFPCKTGTKWEEVKITLIENEVVRIETPQGSGRFSYHEVGMSDKRSANKPTMLWSLFEIFAKNQGFISPDNIEYDPKLPDTAKRLNKHLQDLFDIRESIFTDHYKAEKGYKTKIFFSDQTIAD
jgi:hypothetical protein